MLDQLDNIDRKIFLVLNGHHTAWLDTCMWYISKMQFWFPVYAFMIFCIYRKLSLRSFLVAVFGIALLLFITDFMAVHFVKNTVMRLRPSHQPELEGQVKLVQDAMGNWYKGGRYGFFSNHASNHFGVAMFFFLLMKPMKPVYAFLLFAWAAVVSYSRIYLGVHYPFDILSGAVYGMFSAIVVYALFLLTLKRMNIQR